MTSPAPSTKIDSTTLLYLRELRNTYPTIDAALARIAVLRSSLTLPKGAIHVISDVHGEYKKLRHVVNNASGSLRPLVSKLFHDKLSEQGQLQLLGFIYYPRESFLHYSKTQASRADTIALTRTIIGMELSIIRALSQSYPLHAIAALLPSQYLQVFRELILSPQFERSAEHFDAIVDSFIDHGRELDLLRLTARLIRNLAISELIVAGDLGDRGERIDKAIDFLTRQPHVSITWGNHDVSWMAACLGHEASVATVMRMSLRYGRLSQLEEGYGIPLEPVAKLVAADYSHDPASQFACKDIGDRDPLLLARMQKAMAMIQFKLDGQLIARNPHFKLGHRDILSSISPDRSQVTIDGKQYSLIDSHLPTVDPANPLALTKNEESCLRSLVNSFTNSATLWRHMTYLARKGSMWLVRDNTLIFHGCVPSDALGNLMPFEIGGVSYTGRALYDAIEVAVQRAFQSRKSSDLDLLWYLWCGPLSPLFGKDKIATFESYLIADKSLLHEHKDPYFTLIHDVAFCEKVFREFNVDPARGLIVNGHVPVKIEAGESPIKRSGRAVTIDGAFSEAYGDKGYTLVLQPDRSYLALHHHFQSVEDTVENGTDMIPETLELTRHERVRRIGDTEQGAEIRQQIQLLETLIQAYEENKIEPLSEA
jgi:fructose-1,6-bisphosphatase-3